MAYLKFFVFVMSAVLFIVHHQVAGFFFRDEEKKLHYFLSSIQLTCRWGLRILNIKVEKPLNLDIRGHLLISNHLSYIDILVLFSFQPALFVTSTEMREVFFLGRITKLAGCFFVERRKDRRDAFTTQTELSSMKEKLEAGFNVFLFPEGTSSDGRTVLPFKATFFQSSLDLEVNVKPFVLTYDRKDLIPWYGDMTFPDHLLRLCREKGFSAKIAMLDDISPGFFKDRFEMSQHSHQSIKEYYEAS